MTPSERLSQLGLTPEEIRRAQKRTIEFAASSLIETHGNRAIGIAKDECIATLQDGKGNRFWSRVHYEIKKQLGALDGGWKNQH